MSLPRRTVATVAASVLLVPVAFVGLSGADDDRDGLTYKQAQKAQKAAKKRVSGRVVEIDREKDDGRVTYDVRIITKKNRVREVELNSRFRVRDVDREDRDGLTYARVGKASSAARKVVRGIVTDVERDDDGYEVEILTSKGKERTVELDRKFRVVTDDDRDDDDEDDRDDD
ncbi:MAG: PepSY domain-containing protein [Solirubrobacteraceae bacterium]|nr:PepSY domain-containing protein [Solirubrobacteraceae bacterium]